MIDPGAGLAVLWKQMAEIDERLQVCERRVSLREVYAVVERIQDQIKSLNLRLSELEMGEELANEGTVSLDYRHPLDTEELFGKR